MLRPDVTAHDVLRLVHGIVMATEQSPQDTDRLLGMMLDGLRTSAAGRFRSRTDSPGGEARNRSG